jgi:DNA-binding XRE family transcriptional regulator
MTNEDLAAAMKAWRGKATQREAAARLGITTRTLQGIEHGRGIAHPSLLLIALKAVKNPEAMK